MLYFNKAFRKPFLLGFCGSNSTATDLLRRFLRMENVAFFLERQLKLKIWIKVIILTFVSGLQVQPILASQEINFLSIPSQYGTVKEVFRPQAVPENSCTIIYIQDADCNYQAQKNMAQFLEYLVKEHSLKLIMVEGGSGSVSQIGRAHV